MEGLGAPGLEAYVGISGLVYRYAELIDAGDFEGVGVLLAHAELTAEGAPGVIAGADGIAAHYERWTRRHPGGTPLTKHVTTNLQVDVDDTGDSAGARSYFTVLQAVPGELALQPVIAGRYSDRFELVDGTWRFSARHIVPELFGDLSAHLRNPVP